MSLVNDLINTSLTTPQTHTHTIPEQLRLRLPSISLCVPAYDFSSGIHMGFISPPSCNPSPNYFLFQFPEEVVKWFLNQTSFFSSPSLRSHPHPSAARHQHLQPLPTTTFTILHRIYKPLCLR